jgi:hypothetical protein
MNDLRTITLPRVTVEQALEALETGGWNMTTRAITDLRAALAQQDEPVEPVAWVASKDGRVIYDNAFTHDVMLRVAGDFEDDEQRARYAQRIVDKLNAAPPQRKPLTEEEIYLATGHCGVNEHTAIKITRAVEAEHGIKE